VLNTSRPFGAELPVPSAPSLEMMRGVAARGRPFVSNLFIGAVTQQPAVIVAVPVIRGGQVRYILDFPLQPTSFTQLLREAALSPGWIATITDRDGTIVARVPDTGDSVGRPAPARWLQGVGRAAEGFLEGRVLTDAPVYAAFKRSRETGWVVGVAAPATAVEAPFQRSLLALSAGGLGFLTVASALAFVLSRRITGPIAGLARSVREPQDAGTARSSVTEVEELRRALEEGIQHKVAGEALREADRRKDEFLAVLSHELRNPLNAMLGWLRLLRGGTLDAPATRRALDVIERSVDQQRRLIADLLDTSRIVAGKLTLKMEPVDLPALVGGVVEAARPGFEAKSVTLTSSVLATAGTVQGDPERLRQVVENLLSNALKFTPEGGLVTVTLARGEGDTARLTVADTGIGISADFLPHIFERFRQADSASTRSQAGLGLGLAIVQYVVQAHGGSLRASSGGPGKGATFRVDLRVRKTRARPAAREPAAVSARSLEGVTVLIVEDDADTRELLAAVVAQHGGMPATVSGAREALAAIPRRRPDVLVCDIAMPGDDGFTLIRALRSRPADEGGTTPAVAVTAYARVEDAEAILTAGFQAHLAKPAEPAELVRVIGALVAATPAAGR
jgi:signal transduction histidine kinase/ActR/RegA family two-component response regulator